MSAHEEGIKMLRFCTLLLFFIGICAGLCLLLEWLFPGFLDYTSNALESLWKVIKLNLVLSFYHLFSG